MKYLKCFLWVIGCLYSLDLFSSDPNCPDRKRFSSNGFREVRISQMQDVPENPPPYKARKNSLSDQSSETTPLASKDKKKVFFCFQCCLEGDK